MVFLAVSYLYLQSTLSIVTPLPSSYIPAPLINFTQNPNRPPVRRLGIHGKTSI